MKRYFKTLRLFWSTAVAAEMEYRVNFVLSALNAVGAAAVGLFGLELLYSHNDNALGGWSWEQALVVLGLFEILRGVTTSFLDPNLTRIVRYVYEGTLDFVLLKPMDSQFWLSTRNVSPWGIPDMLIGLGILIFAGVRLDVPFGMYFVGLIPVGLALLVLYSLWFVFASFSIWYVKIWNATEVLRGLLEAGRYPRAAFPGFVQIFFTFVVPVAFMTTVPAEVLMGEATVTWMIAEAAIAIGLFMFSRVFWRFALRYYTSASS